MGKTRILIVLLVCCMAGVSCSGPGTSDFVGNNEASQGISGGNTTAPQGTIHNPDVLEQVLALEAPGGVDIDLFAELQNELARQVSTRPSQLLQSHLPDGKANRIGDLMFDGTGLSWSYANVGDYDFNGEVNGSDITPIVIHFGKTAGDADWLVAKAADGDGNGEVNLGDIASIAINFGSSVSGYVVLGSESEDDYPNGLAGDDGAGTQVLGEIDLGGITGDAAGRQMLSITPTTQLAGNLFWVRPFYGEQFGDASYLSTNIGSGLDFHVKRLDDFNLHDRGLDDSFFVIPNRSADEITLDIWTTDTQAAKYVAFDTRYDTAGFKLQDYKATVTGGSGSGSNPIQFMIDESGNVGAGVIQYDEAKIHSGLFAHFPFTFEISSPSREIRVGSTLVNETYHSYYLDETNRLDGFTINSDHAQPDQPASFTLYSVFMTGDGDDNGITNRFDVFQFEVQGNTWTTCSDANFAPAATDYDQNCESNLADSIKVGLHFNEAVDSIEILIWDTGEYADEAPATSFGFFDGTPSKRHDTFPFAATTDWRDVFRSWDGEITIGMMQAADLNEDGEVLVSARLRYEDQLGLPFTGIPFTYSE